MRRDAARVWTGRTRRVVRIAWTRAAPIRSGLLLAWKTRAHFVEAVLFAWLLLFFNVFGQVTAVERYGYTLFNQLFAPENRFVYGYGKGAQARTVVVLYRDVDLKGKSWPVSYGEHAQHLSRVRAGKPAAVMIDYVFVDPRPDPSIAHLRRELKTFETDHIRVFLASPHEETPQAPNLRQELRGSFASPVAVPGLVGSASGSGYPLFVFAPGPQKRKPTAALAIYAQLCNAEQNQNRSLCEPPSSSGSSARVLQMHEAGWALELFWGMNYPADMSNVACRPIPDFLARFWTILWSHGEGFRVDCPFTPTVMIDELVRHERDVKWLTDTFHDKVVFYGASFLAGSDIVFPPTHFSLPGVYSHAMAMDNLLTFGTKYKREAIEGPLPLVTHWLQEAIRSAPWLPAHSRLEATMGCFGEELKAHCVQYILLFLVLLYLHVVSSIRACLFDATPVAAISRRGRRALALLLSAAWTVTLSIIAPLILVLSFTLRIEFEWLNLTAGNWLEALLEAWAGHQWGPPLVTFVLALLTARPTADARHR